MNNVMHSAWIVAVASLVTIAIRFLPFILFPESREVPKFLTYLSNVLPAAIMGMLVVYCFRNTDVVAFPYAIPEILATAVVVGSYLWKKNFLISIAVGTVLYMILVQLVFI
ncbi:MAG: AzlD domain-containing protein [Lachnospiraceae bacterium]|nr:AzlD domain-containing protein [Candidatus Colinaster scatohippi]